MHRLPRLLSPPIRQAIRQAPLKPLIASCLSTSSALQAKIAVVLSGCGVYDGSEIHETAAAMAALTRGGAEVECFAPDKAQYHVIDHTAGSPMDQARNVRTESARIARAAPRPLNELTADQADGVVFPGGFGAAKNLSTFGYEGADMSVDAEVSRVLEEFHSAGKPQALCCISPVVAAKVLGSKGVSLTLGNQGSEADWPYQGSIEAAKSFGANMELKNVDELCVDEANKLVSTPAYMCGTAKYHEVQDGVTNMVNQLLKMV